MVEQPRMRAEAATADIVTNIRPARAERPAPARRRRSPAWSWTSLVLPQPMQVLEQALPNLIMAATAMAILFVGTVAPFEIPLWAPMLMLPSMALYAFANRAVHPMWRRAALVNLATVGAFFPFLIVRQSAMRVPFVEFGNGTLLVPLVSTVAVIFLLVALAFGSAMLCEEDPEYAGIVFLPAALLVPVFAGATEITSLATAVTVVAGVYLASAVLTVVASMLPGAYPTLVAPIAIALEFLVLPLSGGTPIFPVGAGISAKLLFFTVVFAAVGMAIAVPVMAVWARQVRKLVQAGVPTSARTA
ncbi:MAG TPA: hypothetical protein VM450_02865 [Thermomicrobiales bacterium]|nr:hypothetical protein [Thermomicrobiales bacterium]